MPKLPKIKEFFQFQIKTYKKMTERSDFHKYSIFNIQYSFPACPAKVPHAKKESDQKYGFC